MLSAEQIARAQAVDIGDVASERGFAFDRAGNHAGPCPQLRRQGQILDLCSQGRVPVPPVPSEGRWRCDLACDVSP